MRRGAGTMVGTILFALAAIVMAAAMFIIPAVREEGLPLFHSLASRPVPDATLPSPVSTPSAFAAELMGGEVSSTPEPRK